MPSQWQPIIDIQFTAPKLNIGLNQPQLTFGTILRAAGFFTKTLIIVSFKSNLINKRILHIINHLFQQQYTFHETPLNRWIEDQHDDDVDKSANISVTQPSTYRSRSRNYSASLSMMSTASANAASHEVYSNVDANLSFTALEYVLTLLASQSLLALKDANLSTREKQLIKREISSELHEFQDLVKKRVLAINEVRDILPRKKHGISLIRQPYEGRSDKATERPSRLSVGASRSDSMRVLVTRRMHLSALQSPTPSTSTGAQPRSLRFNITQDISHIRSDSPRIDMDDNDEPASSTPASSTVRNAQTRTDPESIVEAAKRRYMAADDPIFFEPEEQPTHDEWKSVNLVEEDYLTFLSNLFFNITK